MAGWGVTEEVVAAMCNMGSALEALTESMKRETQSLRSTFEENQGGLGPHSAEISALLEDIADIENEGTSLVKKLVLRLYKAAKIRAEIIASQRYGGTGRSR